MRTSYNALMCKDSMMKPITLCADLKFYFKKLLGSVNPTRHAIHEQEVVLVKGAVGRMWTLP